MVLLFATILHIRAIPGDIAGVVYATDIRTTLFGAPVTAYNIGGKTCIDAEILNWHKTRIAYANAKDSKTICNIQ